MNEYIELETIQQKITLNLQEIDANIVNTLNAADSILSQMRRFSTHTREFADSIQIWSSFFKDMGKQWDSDEPNLLPPHRIEYQLSNTINIKSKSYQSAYGDENNNNNNNYTHLKDSYGILSPITPLAPKKHVSNNVLDILSPMRQEQDTFYTPNMVKSIATFGMPGTDGKVLNTPLKQLFDVPPNEEYRLQNNHHYNETNLFNMEEPRVPFNMSLFPEEIRNGFHASQIKRVYEEVLHASNKCIDQNILLKKLDAINSEMVAVYLDLLEQKNMVAVTYDYETNTKVIYI